MKNGNMQVSPNTVENIYNARNDSDSWERAALGLTLRQHYAGLALQAMLSNTNVIGFSPSCGWDLVNCSKEQLAQFCIDQADTLLAELEKSE